MNGRLSVRKWLSKRIGSGADRTLTRWSLGFIGLLVVVGVFGKLIANNKPLYCVLAGETRFPAVYDLWTTFGPGEWSAEDRFRNWKKETYESVLWPPIPYGPTEIDMGNSDYVSPFDPQEVVSLRWRHWLGTDKLGRDVLSALISGAGIALLVGLLAMSVALLIGLTLGSLAGYFGNSGMRITRLRLVLNLFALFPALFYGFIARKYAIAEGSGAALVVSVLIFVGVILLFNGIAALIERARPQLHRYPFPLDDLIMRFIEVINSIPGLLLLLSLVAVLKERSLISIMLIIGLIGWTGIARFTRAELLKIRQLEYITAARALGYSDFRILLRHALPNALKPVLIATAFGIAGAVLLEASLSFLGIGAGTEEMSWGYLLNLGRKQTSAWWLALFPGLAICLTVLSFNLVGEALSERVSGE